jgi:hypothetical protein
MKSIRDIQKSIRITNSQFKLSEFSTLVSLKSTKEKNNLKDRLDRSTYIDTYTCPSTSHQSRTVG